MDDKTLIKEIQRGKKEYLNHIAEKYYDDIYRFCCFQTGSVQDAYDLTQETFLKFIRYVDSYKFKNLKGYLLTIAMNVCRDYYGKPERKYASVVSEEEIDRVRGGEMSLREKGAAGDLERRLVLLQALAALPPQQRAAIILLYAYGYKYREIARMTGMNLSTVKSRVYQGTEKLRQMLRKEDFYG